MQTRIMTRRHTLPAIILIAAMLGMTLMMPLTGARSYAADIPLPGTIRVALFIDSRGTVPAVTLSSSKPLSIGLRRPDGVQPWLTSPAGASVRFALSDYSIRLLDTDDYAAALSAYEKAAPFGEAVVYAAVRQGRTLYQVRLGGYRSSDEAIAARSRLPSGLFPDIESREPAGPLYAAIGTYPSLDEALNHQSAFASSGVVSHIAVHPADSGKIVYSLWIGEAASKEALDKAARETVQLAGVAAVQVEPGMPYLLLRNEAPLTGGSDGRIRYQFNSHDQNVRIEAEGGADITVSERFGRTYRGSMEVTSYAGKLALINELPLEQYLYSVVGSELGAGWPLEALKAQAVAARTFAVVQGMKYKIAHVSDTTYDQAYKGKSAEFPEAVQAVDETKSEVLTDGQGLITPSYSSNSGGMTADSLEAWTSSLPYIRSVPSPDKIAQDGKLPWYRISLPNGSSGYIRSDYAVMTGKKNDAGLPYIQVTENNVNIRRAPYVDNANNAPVMQAALGQTFVAIGQEIESNPFNWIRGPYTAEQLKSTINARSSAKVQGALMTLEVSRRGPSDRVIEMKANGMPLVLPNPDAFRSALNGLPSTRFDVEETGRFTVLGAGGRKAEYPASAAVLAAAGSKTSQPIKSSEFYVMNDAGQVRVATLQPQFRFHGYGFGHGVGMSQYGAKALAEQGYDYKSILQYYYNGVSIVKG